MRDFLRLPAVGLEPTYTGLGARINRAFADTAFEKVIKR